MDMKETKNKMIGWTLEGIRDTLTKKANREGKKEANRAANKEANREANREGNKEVNLEANREANREANKEVLAVWAEAAEAVWAEAGETAEVEQKELVRYLFLTYTITIGNKLNPIFRLPTAVFSRLNEKLPPARIIIILKVKTLTNSRAP